MALSFVDTNVFVYAQDGRDETKRQAAIQLLRRLLTKGEGVISTQVVQEFCNVAAKPDVNLPETTVKAVLEVMFYPMLRHAPDLAFYRRALKLHRRDKLSFYDALMVQAALDLGCQTLYSEDLQAGRAFGRLTVVNPFAA